jgi:hypothetical protein
VRGVCGAIAAVRVCAALKSMCAGQVRLRVNELEEQVACPARPETPTQPEPLLHQRLSSESSLSQSGRSSKAGRSLFFTLFHVLAGTPCDARRPRVHSVLPQDACARHLILPRPGALEPDPLSGQVKEERSKAAAAAAEAEATAAHYQTLIVDLQVLLPTRLKFDSDSTLEIDEKSTRIPWLGHDSVRTILSRRYTTRPALTLTEREA